MQFVRRLFVLVGIVSLCNVVAGGEIRIQGGGSSYTSPLYHRWMDDYQKGHSNIRIDYQAMGNAAGIKGITENTWDFGGANSFTPAQARDKFLAVPAALGAVTCIYNLPGIKSELRLTPAVIAEIYLGNIRRWNHPQIVKLNPKLKLPDLAISPVHRTDGCGTNLSWTQWLCAHSDAFRDSIGVGKSVEWPCGPGAGQGAGPHMVVMGTPGSIGYVEWVFAVQNHIAMASLLNADGEFVAPTTETISAASRSAAAAMRPGLPWNVMDQRGNHVYPVCNVSYILLPLDLERLNDRAKAEALVDFIRWGLHDGQKIAGPMDYPPLDDAAIRRSEYLLNFVRFGGRPIGNRADAGANASAKKDKPRLFRDQGL